jgi:hypothetical protein
VNESPEFRRRCTAEKARNTHMTHFSVLRRALGAACALALLLPAAGVAQEADGERAWRVIPSFGGFVYDDASALETSPFVGGELMFPVSQFISLGASVSFARPEVDGSQFPLALFQVSNDTTVLFEVGQQVTHVSYTALASVGTSFGRVRVYGQSGVGGYTLFLDPQANTSLAKIGAPDKINGLLIPVGAGLSFDVGSRAGIRIDVRDEIFTDYDRDILNPVEPRFFNDCVDHFQESLVCFPELNPTATEAKSTVHNIRLTLGFEFTPGG